ncbi:MAG: 1-acyl-sn-glycerol-3-phosphate acyltransferase [Spirochaetales bacterium]|jgi:hypothetical protein|nr:1-acyl-sn-glycerol-3-phosphate acyltransferase [Spirochaetales bacterium]
MVYDFEDIRPYTEEEYPVVIKRIVSSKHLLDGIRKLKFPHAPGFLKFPLNFFIKRFIKKQLRDVHSRLEFQKKFVIGVLMNWVITKTTQGLSFSGAGDLKKDEAYLYITNHRDIVLDVAFLSCVLDRMGFSTLEIAIGDNLMSNQFVEDLIRINRSFIVKRNLPPREQITASVKLSAYINDTLSRGNSVWIAQREGRAKDGDDLTNPAVIKMIYLSRRKSGISFQEFINGLNIIPVAISYEFDPLDNLKAWEIHHKESRGSHKKRSNEDLVSMFYGITGKKGRVHLSFGSPLRGDFENERAVAQALDDFILNNYKLWPSAYIAWDELLTRFPEDDLPEGLPRNLRFPGEYTPEEKKAFLKRFKYLKPGVARLALLTYARPLLKKLSPSAAAGDDQ